MVADTRMPRFFFFFSGICNALRIQGVLTFKTCLKHVQRVGKTFATRWKHLKRVGNI